jgi:hypothetical protein
VSTSPSQERATATPDGAKQYRDLVATMVSEVSSGTMSPDVRTTVEGTLEAFARDDSYIDKPALYRGFFLNPIGIGDGWRFAPGDNPDDPVDTRLAAYLKWCLAGGTRPGHDNLFPALYQFASNRSVGPSAHQGVVEIDQSLNIDRTADASMLDYGVFQVIKASLAVCGAWSDISGAGGEPFFPTPTSGGLNLIGVVSVAFPNVGDETIAVTITLSSPGPKASTEIIDQDVLVRRGGAIDELRFYPANGRIEASDEAFVQRVARAAAVKLKESSR